MTMQAAGRGQDEVLRVTTLELFFDLVFVFAVTQLASVLVAQLSPLGMLQITLLFGVLWWMYGGYAWLTNTIAPTGLLRRLLLLVAMAGFMIVALATPQAFTGGGVAWGLGYLLVVLVHAALYLQSNRGIVRVLPFNILAALLVIAAGLVNGPAVYALWTTALLTPIVTPYFVAPSRFNIRPTHIVERYGCALLVTLGESVIAVGIAVSRERLDLEVVGAVVLGLAVAAALWWLYFGGDDARAERALAAAPPERRAALTLSGYFYATIPLVLGIVAIAAGLKLSIGHAGSPLPIGPALALAGGAALYLAGAAAFRRALRIGPLAARAGGAALALATIPLGAGVAAWAQLVALLGVLVAVLLAERLRG